MKDRPEAHKNRREIQSESFRRLLGKILLSDSISKAAVLLNKDENWVRAELKRLRAEIRAEQFGTAVVEYIFGYNTREAEDYTPPAPGTPTSVTSRKGSKPTTVVEQHESDEAILYRLYGGDKKEEDWRDFTNPVLHIVREYKPKLSKEIVADALGKLVQGQNSYKRRYGVTPALEFVTRVKVDKEVLEDIRTIGAKAFQLTKSNQLVEMTA